MKQNNNNKNENHEAQIVWIGNKWSKRRLKMMNTNLPWTIAEVQFPFDPFSTKYILYFFLLRHHFTPVNCWWSDCTTNKIYKNKYLIKTRGEDQRIFYHSFFLLPYVCFCVRFVIVAITIPIRCYIPIFCLLLIKQRQQLAKVWLKTIHSSI